MVADTFAEDRSVVLEEGRSAADGLLAADGIVPEGAGAVVLRALQVAPASGGGVLELLVAIVAVVLAQRHLPRLPFSSSASLPPLASLPSSLVCDQEFCKNLMGAFASDLLPHFRRYLR